jgi:hypothetical protein
MEMPPSAPSLPGNRPQQPPTARASGFWFALRSLAKGAKVTGQADGLKIIRNEDDTDPAAGQAAVYVNI